MTVIYYDPSSFVWVPNLENYHVEVYNPPQSYLVRKEGEEGVNVIDLGDYNGLGSCTCPDFGYRKDPNNNAVTIHNPSYTKLDIKKYKTCKHINLVRYLLRKQSNENKL